MNKTILHLVTAFLLAGVFACSGDPLLTDLRNNNLTVIIKGTYESNSPRPWITSWPVVEDDSINMYPVKITTKPNTFMIDITGMSLSGNGDTSRFGNKRKTYECATDDSADFFNGTGITMRNDDVSSGKEYKTLNLYLRKLLFSDAMKYELANDGWHEEKFRTYFDEKRVDAFNFNLLLINYFYDLLRYENDGDDANRIYPLKIDISNGLVFDPDDEVVLEVRLVIKNFVKLYEYNRLDYASSRPYVVHYFGVSDWLRDVQKDDNMIGGNLHAVARTYVKGRTGSVKGSAISGNYVIGIPEESNINEYMITSSNLRNTHVQQAKIPPQLVEASDSVPAILTYLMQREKYKTDWTSFVNAVKGATSVGEEQTFFENEWTAYNEAANNFKIPPLATCANSSNEFTITNIAPGKYKFYRVAAPTWGTLFTNATFTPIGGVVEVVAGVEKTIP